MACYEMQIRLPVIIYLLFEMHKLKSFRNINVFPHKIFTIKIDKCSVFSPYLTFNEILI